MVSPSPTPPDRPDDPPFEANGSKARGRNAGSNPGPDPPPAPAAPPPRPPAPPPPPPLAPHLQPLHSYLPRDRAPARACSLAPAPRRSEPALTTLLSNAVQYSPGSEDVRITVVPDGDHAVISVADQGDGIPLSELERVFDRFYKGGAAKSEPGAGLGLYLVRMIAEAHGGSVSVSSKSKKGSTFTIRLPLAR